MAPRWWDRFSGPGPWPVEDIEHIRFMGLIYKVDPETGVSYLATSYPSYDPTITVDFDFDSLNQEFLAQVRDHDPLSG